MKSLNRLENALARSEWNDAAIAEGLTCTSDGAIVSGAMSLFLRSRRLLASDRRTCGVAGVLRDKIRDYAKAHGIPLTMMPLHRNRLVRADEVFRCDSLIGIRPIVSCGEVRWSVGPLIQRLRSALFRSGDGC